MDMVYETDLETAMTGHTIQLCLFICVLLIKFVFFTQAHDKGNSREVLNIIQFS